MLIGVVWIHTIYIIVNICYSKNSNILVRLTCAYKDLANMYDHVTQSFHIYLPINWLTLKLYRTECNYEVLWACKNQVVNPADLSQEWWKLALLGQDKSARFTSWFLHVLCSVYCVLLRIRKGRKLAYFPWYTWFGYLIWLLLVHTVLIW